MKNEVNRLFVYATASFISLIIIWLIVSLLVNPNSNLYLALSAISIIPCTCYIYWGTKLLSRLGLDKFYLRYS